MIEERTRPCGRVVALLASLWESRLHVIRVGGALKVWQVARDTGGISQVVVSVHVTLHALHRDVGSSQRETGSAVIKTRT